MDAFYSLGILRAKPGKEHELLAVWQALCDGFDQLDGPPSGPVTLVQNTTETGLHYSFAPWRSLEDLEAMRRDPRTMTFFRQASELCTEITPGMFRVVGRSAFVRAMRMNIATSSDGTPVAFGRSGMGPPLVLVHGTTADHTRWHPLLPELEKHCTVYAMDRCGRGESGDRDTYAIEREYDDVAAVVNAAGPGVFLVGHSFGALCALEATLLTSTVSKLILYEPVFPTEGEVLYPPGSLDKFQALLEQGDRDALLTTFFRELVGLSDEEINLMRDDPSWTGRLAAAHTAVRELADGDYVFEPRRFSNLTVPTLLLVGENSARVLRKPSELIAAALPNSRLVEMPGQRHAAITTAPSLFLREVMSFLNGEESGRI